VHCLSICGRQWFVLEFGLQVNSKCSQLKHIDLSYCTGLCDGTVSGNLSSLPLSIRELSLCGVMLRNTELITQAISRLTSLRHINLCGVPALTDDAMDVVCGLIVRC